jgi:hypothetical protein
MVDEVEYKQGTLVKWYLQRKGLEHIYCYMVHYKYWFNAIIQDRLTSYYTIIITIIIIIIILLSRYRVRQLYRIESLHLPGHSVTDVVFMAIYVKHTSFVFMMSFSWYSHTNIIWICKVSYCNKCFFDW